MTYRRALSSFRQSGLLGVTGAAATGLLATFATAPAAASPTRDRGRGASETTPDAWHRVLTWFASHS
jgi:hypothetical protein